jgi:hypothetical protein
MTGRRISERVVRRAVAALLAAAVAQLASGCASKPTTPDVFKNPPYSARIDQQLQRIEADTKPLFAELQAPSPSCRYDANGPAFAKVDAGLAQLNTLAAAGDTGRSAAAAADLSKSWRQFEKAYTDGNGGCLPAMMVANQQQSFDLALGRMRTYEQSLKGGG